VERLAQRSARMVLIELGPEERDEGIAAVESPGACCGEVGEQRDALWLGQYRPKLAATSSNEVHHPQNSELDHGESPHSGKTEPWRSP
jgi:hypothetical protein